jgi:hypothetical protein
MSACRQPDWLEADQRHLHRALARVRSYLTGNRQAAHGDARADVTDAPGSDTGVSALDTLCRQFGLSSFERNCLLLCAGMELDSGFAADCLAADPMGPTFALALSVLPEPHWNAVTPSAPLRQWRLLELDQPGMPTRSRLRIDERILHYLLGINYQDERLQGLLVPLPVQAGPTPSQAAVGERLLEIWHPDIEPPHWPHLYLRSERPASAQAAAAHAASRMGVELYRLPVTNIPTAEAEVTALTRLCEREFVLSGSVLLVDADGLSTDSVMQAGRRFIEHIRVPMMITGKADRLTTGGFTGRAAIPVDVPLPTHQEQRQLWQTSLGELGSKLNGELDELVMQFELDHLLIRQIGSELAHAPHSEPEMAEQLWRHCRTRSRVGMNRLAQPVRPVATWDDLVLPPTQLEILQSLCAQIRHRAKVYERWGFAQKSNRGLGISALFTGQSGTGKTMAAEVLANELELDLYHVDLSQVVSKYIGETEKNLRQVFDSAEQSGAILLFDEADALFGKRSDIKDSHDRYANIEVSYLLQRMEAHRGLAILTTNLKENLDPAFVRRLRFIVRFPFPDPAQRAEIWRRVFPQDLPREELDPQRLAQLNVPGGNIRNIALNAAFLAADAGTPVTMQQVLRAARGEYAKLDRTVNESEIRGWQ